MSTSAQFRGKVWVVLVVFISLLLLVSPDLQQAVMIAAVVYMVLRKASRMNLLAGSRVAFRAGLGLVICLLVAGQLHGGNRTFPFVPWDMYGKALPAHGIMDDCHLVGIDRQGEKRQIVPARLFPTLGRGTCRASNYFRICVVAVLNGNESVEGGRMEKMARAFVQEYEQESGIAIQEIQVLHRKTPFRGGDSTEQLVASFPNPS